MDENTANVKTQETEELYSGKNKEENEYKLFNYYKNHTGLLIASVSALVAIISFIFRFAVGRMNFAYLDYWDISNLYANISNQNELYMVITSALFAMAVMVIHWLLSGSTASFKYYVEFLYAVNQEIKEEKKYYKEIKEYLDKFSNKLKNLDLQEERVQELHEIEEKYKKDEEKSKNYLKKIRRNRKRLLKILFFDIFITIFLSCLIGGTFVFLIGTSGSIRESFRLSSIIVWFIIFYVILYLLRPVLFTTIRVMKRNKEKDALKKIKELLDEGFPDSPIERFIKIGIKPMLSDKKIGSAIFQAVLYATFLLCSMSFYGNINAKCMLSFPIYIEEEITYAIVYTNGLTKFMEEATIKDGTITIDTRKQRIITTDDISYNIELFDDVSVIKIEEEKKFIQPTDYIKEIANSICQFCEANNPKAEEVTAENEESISGDNREPEACS